MEEWVKIPAAVCANLSRTTGTSDLCNCKQSFLYQIFSIFLLYQILISSNKIEVNNLKSIQRDFLDLFLLTVEVYLR